VQRDRGQLRRAPEAPRALVDRRLGALAELGLNVRSAASLGVDVLRAETLAASQGAVAPDRRTIEALLQDREAVAAAQDAALADIAADAPERPPESA